MSASRFLLKPTKLFPLLLYGKTFIIFNNKFFSITTICFVSFLYSVFNEHKFSLFYQRKLYSEHLFALVGPSGLEPPTSCLSGTRSNLLSYEPMWLVWIFSHLNSLPSLSRKLLCLPFFSKKVSGGDEGIRLSRELRAQSFAALTIINRHSLPLLLRIPP